MRVLTFTSLFPNNINPTHGIFIYQRMSHFASRGHEVVVSAPVPYYPSWLPTNRWNNYRRVMREELIGNLKTYHPRYPLLPKISMPFHGWLMFRACLPAVRRLQAQYKFDFIDSHYVYPDGFAAVLVGRALGLPVIVSARGSDLNLFPSFRLIRPMIRWTLRQAAGTIAVSTPLQDVMCQLGLSREKVQVIGNGVDLRRFFVMERLAARKQLGLPEDAEIIVSVGGLVEAKGHDLLISAMAELGPRRAQAKLYIIGAGPLRTKLEAWIAERGLQDRVSLVGPQPNEQLALWYNAADVSCLASSREGWPNVIAESMACGTPVVATGVGGVSEVITSAQLGLIVERSAHSIAQGLEEALAREWDPEVLHQHAQLRTWDVVAEEIERYFQGHISSKTARQV